MSDQNKKISIIIPVYNTEKYLNRAINSILNSSIKDDIEIIVVDDASPGNCKEIIEEYLNVDIKYIQHKQNKGLFSARYTGIMHATGEFIAHLDPDDWVINDIYKKAYDNAISNNTDVVLFNLIQCDEQGNEWIDDTNIIFKSNKKSGKRILEEIFLSNTNRWNLHLTWNKIIKRTLATKILKYFTNIKHLILAEDLLWSTALFLELFNKNSISFIEDTGIVYFKHSNAITKKEDLASITKKIKDTQYVYEEIQKLFKIFNVNKYFKYMLIQTKYIQLNRLFGMKSSFSILNNPIKYCKIYFFLKFTNEHKIEKLIVEELYKIIIRKIQKKNIKELSIYGLGNFSTFLLTKFKEKNIKINSFVVTNKIEQKEIYNIPIYSFEEIRTLEINTFCIAAIKQHHIIEAKLRNNYTNCIVI